jgi:HAD superfamily hydrolase (TIGR01509 family)
MGCKCRLRLWLRARKPTITRSCRNSRRSPEVVEHIEARHGEIPFAVVSGSTRESVIKSLRTLRLLDRFETLVCAGDYKNAKPHPEAFLLAAERLGVAPAKCLVFEDTEMGIQAATAAGMASVRVLQPWERVSSN